MVTAETKLRKLKDALKQNGMQVEKNGSITRLAPVPASEQEAAKDTSRQRDQGNDEDSDGVDEHVPSASSDDDEDDDDDDKEASPKPRKRRSGGNKGGRTSQHRRTIPTHHTRSETQSVSSETHKAPAKKTLAIESLEAAETILATKDKKEDDPMAELIYSTIKEDLFRNAKFANGPDQRRAVTAKCLEKMDLEDFRGDTPDKVALRNRWIKANEGTVIKKLNKVRNYAGTQSRNAANSWMKENGGHLPTLEALEKCLKRDLDMDNDDDYELFKWCCDELIPSACGTQSLWNPEKRHCLTMSTAAPPNKPGSKHITSSTEAMAVCYVENFRSKWTEVWKLRNVPELSGCTKFQALHKTVHASDGKTLAFDYQIDANNRKRCNLNGPKWLGKHTEVDMGPGKDSGWNKAGRQDFVKWMNMNKEARRAPKCLEVEQAYLTKLKDELGIIGVTAAEERARKRRKKPKKVFTPADDVEMVYDSE